MNRFQGFGGGHRFDRRCEIGHQKSPMRPEKLRTRRGVLDGIASAECEIEMEGDEDETI
jgi:hypothetical protein